MSSSPSRPRSSAVAALAVVFVLAVAACAGSGGGPDPSAPGGSPAPGSPTPGGTPPAVPSDGPVVDIPSLVGAGDHDGKLVTVRGFFVTDGTTARFCDAVMESYPPQCGGTVLALDGTVPPAVLEQLERADDPALADVAWGQVEIRGTYSAAGPDGQPVLELREMRVVD